MMTCQFSIELFMFIKEEKQTQKDKADFINYKNVEMKRKLF